VSDIPINLYSDTQTLPTPPMREAMAAAAVGDEQKNADPTVNRLCATVAALTGKAAAVLLPSGTMCNLIAGAVHCRSGDEIIADHSAHILNTEAGGAAVVSGALIRPVDGQRGIFTPAQAEQAIRPDSRYSPRSRLLVIEQTSNMGGGTVWPLSAIQAVAGVARRHGLVLHMDGARLLNAVVASGVSAREYCAPFDSVWIDLSKGLGCPVGAVLAGDADFIAAAWRWKQRLGGAMRQAGVLAAAGLYALEHHVERLAEDHQNARRFAERISPILGLGVEPEAVETNMVFIDVTATGLTAAEFSERLTRHGVQIGAVDRYRLRAVTHLDITPEDVEAAAAVMLAVCRAL